MAGLWNQRYVLKIIEKTRDEWLNAPDCVVACPRGIAAEEHDSLRVVAGAVVGIAEQSGEDPERR